ncbi:GYDIA family GHMP kinase [Peredibacter starrii]|uniref:GYDIA family GHMP kinase n=1 Tax=Peredibacter starrii TaxID=28202 RepID=A0AAX4HJE4_9BACT|nr:GYDIA family GHMP kinase [Peredibacter starrii]WPU63144.1 GYDIA family GHMP kinase [Peredibacter starrii]
MRDQYFYGHGKLLLSGEYFVLDGAQALALPTTVGQSMKVKYRHSYQPTLNWKSVDHTGKTWFEADYEFWHFKPIRPTGDVTEKFVQDCLSAVRLQNPHFLRDDMDVFVETKIEFPLEWGLGSSSTFIYNVAQWAYVSPFELIKKTIGGSGYDIACAQAMGPLCFQKFEGKPQWESAPFNPSFKDDLYFVYLGQKQNSAREVVKYTDMKIEGKSQIVAEISQLTKEMIHANDLVTFNKIIKSHEDIVASALKYEKVKDLHFSDYWGEVKSLGAWGGDFALATSNRAPQETREYFENKGFTTVIPFTEIVRSEIQ